MVPLELRSINNTDWSEKNWIGSTWKKEFNNRKMPSLNQISDGLVAEAVVQVKLAMGDIKD